MAVPYTFGSATSAIPLSQLDSNFATTITLGNTAIQLGNTVTTLNNMTFANVTISSGTSNISSTSIANGTSNVSVNSSGGNITVATNGTTAITIDTSQGVAFAKGFTVGATAAPAFYAYASSTQTGISSGVFTKIQLNAELFDTANAFDSTTNYRFTPQVAGYYQFNGQFTAYASGGGATLTAAYISIKKNGTTYYDGNYLPASNASNNWGVVVSNILYMNGTTDYVELWGYLTGVGLQFNNSTSGNNTYFSGALVRSA